MQITIEGLVKRYGSVTAVDGIDIVAKEGKLTSLVGPSGCGKTTTLRCVAGLERPDAGRITIGDEVVTDPAENIFVPPNKRELGFVFQSFDVWPHLTVFQNVAYPLQNRNVPKDEIRERVTEALGLTGIEHLADKPSTQLSGGQQARVGICRAIVYEPRVLLFDEPLTGLDRNLRKQMRYEIKRIQSELEITSLYVTHSQPEAMTLSDKICLMNTSGTVEQEGTADEIYNHPTSQFSFDFFGSSDAMPGSVVDGNTVETDLGIVETTGVDLAEGTAVNVGFRPEKVDVAVDGEADWNGNQWAGTVADISFLGEMYEVIVDVDGTQVRARRRTVPDGIDEGATVSVHLDPTAVFVFPS